jgi:hypothetical protein
VKPAGPSETKSLRGSLVGCIDLPFNIPQRLSHGRELNDFNRPLVIARKLRANREAWTAVNLRLHRRQAQMSDCVAAWRIAVCPHGREWAPASSIL